MRLRIADCGLRMGYRVSGLYTPRPQTLDPRPSQIRNPEPGSRNPGFVLVCVLWLLAILTVIAVGFGRRAMLDARAAQFTFDHTRAMYLARGAVARGMVELRNKAAIDALYQMQGRTSPVQRWAHTVDMLQEGAYYAKGEGSEASNEACKYTIRDECGFICINAADETLLTSIKALTPAIIRKITRRRGGDPDAGEAGQPFQTIEELRALEGIKDEDWFGEDGKPGLKDLFTCWGDNLININTAPEAVLRSIPDINDNVVAAMLDFRGGPEGELGTDDDQEFVSLEDVVGKAGAEGDLFGPIQQYCKVDSNFFTIKGVATRRQGKVRATCTATVQINGANAAVIKWREEPFES